MTLLGLAQRIGCSESLLSKIERGHLRPSIRILHQIASELGFEVATVMGGRGASAVTIYEAGERPQVWLSGGADDADPVALERAIPWCEGCILDANPHVVPPGCGTEGIYSHRGEEVGFIVEGTIELTVDGQLHRLGPGSTFYFDSRLPHSYVNLGPDVARVFWVNGAKPPIRAGRDPEAGS